MFVYDKVLFAILTLRYTCKRSSLMSKWAASS